MTDKLKHWCRGKETGTGAPSGRRVHTHRESRPNQREIVQRRDTEHEANTCHKKRCNATQLPTPQSTTDNNKEVNIDEESRNQRRQLTHRRKRYNATQLLTPQSTTDSDKKSTQIRNANCVKHCSSTTPSTVFAIPDISAQETQFAQNKQCQEVPELLQMTLRQDTNRKLL